MRDPASPGEAPLLHPAASPAPSCRAEPEMVRGPLIEVRSRVLDSARWRSYRPRSDDIVIATFPKSGTTWMRRIVALLVTQSTVPTAIQDLSPWPDARLFGPVEPVFERAEAMTHRRFFQSHLPFDALPVYHGCKFIHVARDGRDVAMSLHNHRASFTPAAIALRDAASLADPKFGQPWPRASQDAAEFFREGVVDGWSEGDPRASYYHIERSFWAARDDPAVLLVHYNDLKADREGEMRRVAGFLGISVPDSLWPVLIEAAGFGAMRRDADRLLPTASKFWDGGGQRFLHKGTNGRWRDVIPASELATYEARVLEEFPPELANWLLNGRLASCDPQHGLVREFIDYARRPYQA